MSPVGDSHSGRTRQGRAGSSRHVGRRGRKHLVDAWPTYLLNGVGETERRFLSERAAAQDCSVSDVVRGILCARYRLHCQPRSTEYRQWQDNGATNLLLRLPMKLWTSIDSDASESGETKRKIILDAIASYMKGE